MVWHKAGPHFRYDPALLLTLCFCPMLGARSQTAPAQSATVSSNSSRGPSTSNGSRPAPNNGAFIGRAINSLQMPGGSGHLNAIENTLINNLGWTVAKDQVVTDTDITNVISKYSLFYIFCHGITPDGTVHTPFKEFETWQEFFPNPLGGAAIYPSWIAAHIGSAKYALVFINGCASTDSQAGSNASAFAAAFGGTSNSEAYVGWSTEVNMYEAGGDGPLFFEELENGKTVAEAVTANNLQHGNADSAVLECTQNQNNVIDLTH